MFRVPYIISPIKAAEVIFTTVWDCVENEQNHTKMQTVT